MRGGGGAGSRGLWKPDGEGIEIVDQVGVSMGAPPVAILPQFKGRHCLVVGVGHGHSWFMDDNRLGPGENGLPDRYEFCGDWAASNRPAVVRREGGCEKTIRDRDAVRRDPSDWVGVMVGDPACRN